MLEAIEYCCSDVLAAAERERAVQLFGSLEERVVRATARWQLTPRESRVLRHVARGESYEAIATALGCAEGTVELCVVRLLRKARVARRARLIAAFWSTQRLE